MSGFIGRISKGKTPLRPLTIAEPILLARGPDGRGSWQSTDGRVELLFRRLATVGNCSHTDQPVVRSDLGLVGIFDGQLYNVEELATTLKNVCECPLSDAELVLCAYSRWGKNAFAKLRGTFVGCLVDERARTVQLFVDPVGQKPCFIYQGDDEVIFASSVKAIFTTAERELRLDESSVRDFWDKGFVAPSRCILRDVRPLRPGEVLECDWDGEVRAAEIIKPPVEPVSCASFADATSRVRELLLKAVKNRLRGIVSPVCLVSGGIDSTVVSLLCAEVAKPRLLSLGGWSWAVPDIRYARYVAKRLGLELIEVRPNLGNFAQELIWMTALLDEPLAPMSFLPLSLLVREVRQLTNVVFTGDGGDEVFCGYGSPSDWIAPAPREWDEDALVGSIVPRWMSEYGKEAISDVLVGHMFRKLDQASSQQGVEARCPFLDWELIALARQLPPEVLFFGNQPKAILRKGILKDWPSTIVDRRKVGFTFRLRYLWGATLFRGLRDLVASDAVEMFGQYLPRSLRKPPKRWRTIDIFLNFPSVWKLAVWSQYNQSLQKLRNVDT